MPKAVINVCYGGFGLSDAAYKKLIELGVPVRQYVEEKRDPKTGLFVKVPENEGEVIFDYAQTNDDHSRRMMNLSGNRYWDCWTRENRTHPLLVRVVEELGEAASGNLAKLKVVDIPDDVQWTVEEYDGFEHVAEVHRTWS